MGGKPPRPQDGPHVILKPIIFRGDGPLHNQILRPSGDKDNPTIAPSFSHIKDPLDYDILVKTGVIKPGGKA